MNDSFADRTLAPLQERRRQIHRRWIWAATLLNLGVFGGRQLVDRSELEDLRNSKVECQREVRACIDARLDNLFRQFPDLRDEAPDPEFPQHTGAFRRLGGLKDAE